MWNVAVRRGTQKKAQAVCHWLSSCLYDFYLFVLLSLYLAMLDLVSSLQRQSTESIGTFCLALYWAAPPACGLSAGPHGVRAAAQARGTEFPSSYPYTCNHILERLQSHTRNTKQIQHAATHTLVLVGMTVLVRAGQ